MMKGLRVGVWVGGCTLKIRNHLMILVGCENSWWRRSWKTNEVRDMTLLSRSAPKTRAPRLQLRQVDDTPDCVQLVCVAAAKYLAENDVNTALSLTGACCCHVAALWACLITRQGAWNMGKHMRNVWMPSSPMIHWCNNSDSFFGIWPWHWYDCIELE